MLAKYLSKCVPGSFDTTHPSGSIPPENAAQVILEISFIEQNSSTIEKRGLCRRKRKERYFSQIVENCNRTKRAD